MRHLALALTFMLPTTAAVADVTSDVLDQHILPGFAQLADRSAALEALSETHCLAGSADLNTAYGAAFDAWVAVSHLRFGPTETDNRAFALAFWPDNRGKIPKALKALIASEDPVTRDADQFTAVSIAARGFYAMEYLLFDPEFSALGSDAYRCALLQAMASDLATTTRAIAGDWSPNYAELMRHPGDRYRSDAEVRQEMFKALSTGLQIVVDMRLGRPLGTVDTPRPNRAEAYRSGRSLRHVQLSLEALKSLAVLLAAEDVALVDTLAQGFDRAIERATALDDPILAGVNDPARRFRIEALQQMVVDLQTSVTMQLGLSLGVTAGFNSLDGD